MTVKRVVFVADRSFENFDLLSRTAAVAIETLTENFASWPQEIQFCSVANNKLNAMLLQFADSTRRYLLEKHIHVLVAPTDLKDEDRGELVVSLGALNYYPYQDYVREARKEGTIVLEY